jgi:hypothetical protein
MNDKRKYKINARGSTRLNTKEVQVPPPQKNCTHTGMLTGPESPTGPLTGLSVKEVHPQNKQKTSKKKHITQDRKYITQVQVSTSLI